MYNIILLGDIMEDFLTLKMKQKFSKIIFSCVFPFPIQINGRNFYQISSSAPFEHKNIALSMANYGFLNDSPNIMNLLQLGNGHRGFQEYAKWQYMIYRIPLINGTYQSSPVVYFSSNLSDWQKLALRFWYEYFVLLNELPVFNLWNEEVQCFCNYETKEELDTFLTSFHLNEDQYIRKLINNQREFIADLER